MLSYAKRRKFSLSLSPMSFDFVRAVAIIVHKFLGAVHTFMCIAILFQLAVGLPAV